MYKILRVNLKDHQIKWEEVPEYLELFWGRGLTAAVLLKEVQPTCEPLGKHNKLIFSAGPLAGSPVPCSARLSVGGKSPLTGGIKEANAGGNLGHKLGKLKLKGIVIEDKAGDGQLWVLCIKGGEASLVKAPELKGLSTFQTVSELKKRFGGRIAAAVIGPAGEMGLAASGIAVTDVDGRPSRYAARGAWVL